VKVASEFVASTMCNVQKGLPVELQAVEVE
jgi:hypothetical protein